MTTTPPKSNDAALAAFMAGKTEIDALLARIAAASNDHFGMNPERVTWGDAGSLGFVTERLKEITEVLGVGTPSLRDGPDRVPPGGAPGRRGAAVALPTQETRS